MDARRPRFDPQSLWLHAGDLVWFLAIVIPLLVVSLLAEGHPGEWQP